MTKSITIRRPKGDWHLHLRDGPSLGAVLGHTAAQFDSAIIMPNLKPPVTNAELALSYKKRILAAAARLGVNFTPLMTLYLTDKTTSEDIRAAADVGVVAAKLYPANATTNSTDGVTNIKRLKSVFKTMSKCGMVLSIHGETLVSKKYGDKTREGKVGQLRREPVFLKKTMKWLVNSFSQLRIVLEHITTKEAVRFVNKAREGVVATITAHHLLGTLDDTLESHHNKCMPVMKEEKHRQSLLDAATSGSPRFFAGSDSAPHSKSSKETACGCAGCYTALCVIELYTTAFEERRALDMLEGFLSDFGADFYGIERSEETVTLLREKWTIPDTLPFGRAKLVPFWAGKELDWKMAA